MSALPPSVKFLDCAASSAAKARDITPTLPTVDPVDVATALKCMNAFQLRLDGGSLEALDDERNAVPLIAAARILQSTSQHLRSVVDAIDDTPDELSLYAALAFAMHGNFPSAHAALAAVSEEYVAQSIVFRMVAAICDPTSQMARLRSPDESFEPFRRHWYRALRLANPEARTEAFYKAMAIFTQATREGSMAEGALLLGGRMAAHQARRLATINLLEETPEIPEWFVRNAVKTGMVTLLPPQHGLLRIRRIAQHERNTLLTLPTSTGKTFVAEACMAAGLEEGSICVYIAPYVAVGEQVKDSLSKRLGDEVAVVAMFGGFQSDSISIFAEQEVVVATPERFDGWLRSGEDVGRLRTVVFDEIHILENGMRGARVEGLVSRLRLLQRTNPKLRIIGLSAVLTEPQRVCTWLGVEPRDLHEIGWRPTARRLAVCLSDGQMYWIHGNDALRPPEFGAGAALSAPVQVELPGRIRRATFARVNEKSAAMNVAAIARDLLTRLDAPGLIVCPRKLDTRLLARVLSDAREVAEDAELERMADSITERYSYLEFLAGCLRRRVAYHNASLPYDVRRDIERLTRARLLEVVCATTTLAEGADLPFRWTIVSHWLSSMQGAGTPMKSMTFRNIAGRCGRAGAFSEGDTVLFENLMGPPSTALGKRDTKRLEQVMFSSMPLASTFGHEWVETPMQGKKLLEATFGAQLLACIKEQPASDDIVSEFTAASFAGQTDGEQNVRRILETVVDEILDDSLPGGAIAVVNSPIRLTEFGEAANLTGFSPATCRLMMQFLSEESFPSGAALVAALAQRFNNIAEQPNETLRKVFSGVVHRNVVTAKNFESMAENLLSRVDMREVFERLRKKTSKASPDTVETMFEDFVSFIDSVFGNFLPWLLRGLETLSEYGSVEAASHEWSGLAKELERALSARGTEPDLDDSLVPSE